MSKLYRCRSVSMLLLIVLAIVSSFNIYALPRVSLIVASPIPEEPYTLYGHAGLRILDAQSGRDEVYNWGVFDFDKPGFAWNFMMGYTDYQIGKLPSDFYITDYLKRGSNLDEMVLNLNADEVNRLDSLLSINMLPQNRVYRYNFFYNNCATKPLEILQKAMKAKLVFPRIERITYRDLINEAEYSMPWLIFGTDLAVGSPADRPISAEQAMFFPKMLSTYLPKSKIVYDNGYAKPFVLSRQTLYSPIGEEAQEQLHANRMNTPVVLLFAVALLGMLTVWNVRSVGEQSFWHKFARLYSIVVMVVAGLTGCVLFFLAFMSEHPCMWPNANLLIYHPFYLLIALPLLLWKKRGSLIDRCFHFIIFVALIAYFAVSIVLPQHISIANFGSVFAIASVALYRIRISKYKDDKTGEKTF